MAITAFATFLGNMSPVYNNKKQTKKQTITIPINTPSEVTIMLAITIFTTIVGDMYPVDNNKNNNRGQYVDSQ